MPKNTSAHKALDIFAELYPDPRSELDFNDTFQLSIAVLLSAQCTDKKVNQVTPTLFTRYPSYRALAQAKQEDIEEIIRPINYYKTKAKHLVMLGQQVVEKFSGEFPLVRAEALSLPGIGNKTANVILGELGVEPTFPVDTHVFRVSQRLGFAKGKNPTEIEAQIKKSFLPKFWRNLHHWLILHGRRVCKAQNPHCEDCQLAVYCPKIGVTKQKAKASNARKRQDGANRNSSDARRATLRRS